MTIGNELSDGLTAIGKNLAGSVLLTADERNKVLKWTAAMGVAFATGEKQLAENYRLSLNTMLGVVEARSAYAADKAYLQFVSLTIDILIKVGVAALA